MNINDIFNIIKNILKFTKGSNKIRCRQPFCRSKKIKIIEGSEYVKYTDKRTNKPIRWCEYECMKCGYKWEEEFNKHN